MITYSSKVAPALHRGVVAAKRYLVVNAFLCLVAAASYCLMVSITDPWAAYASTVLRTFAVVSFCNCSRESETRDGPTERQRPSFFVRSLLFIAPVESLAYSFVQIGPPLPVSTCLLVDAAAFIPKSLLFELVLDLLHYTGPQRKAPPHTPALSSQRTPTDVLLTATLPFVLASQVSRSFTLLQGELLLAYTTYVDVARRCGLETGDSLLPHVPLLRSKELVWSIAPYVQL